MSLNRMTSRGTEMAKHERSCCPVACTLDIIGDKWTLLVVRDLLLGRSHFREFTASPERIATNILTDRLNRLVSAGLVEKFPSPEQSNRDAYRLTEKGKTLGPIVKAIMKWGLEHLKGTAAMMTPK
ncbi:MAG: winged helix-turn-helix transcriptional regulator [Planctomyces sp.]